MDKKQTHQAWNALGKMQKQVTELENRVLADIQPPLQQERILPFVETTKLVFDVVDGVNGSLQVQSTPLVQSANRQTFITELSVRPVLLVESGGGLNLDYMLKETPFGYINDGAAANTNFLFDFEWGFSLGTTERSYENGRVTASEKFLSRYSLGSPRNNTKALFSPKNPLVLTTNEFFTIKARPTIFEADLAGVYENVTVEFIAAGYRAFSES